MIATAPRRLPRGPRATAWALAFQHEVAAAAAVISNQPDGDPALLHQLLTSARAIAFTVGQAQRGTHIKEALLDAAAVRSEIARLVAGHNTNGIEDQA